MPTSGCATVMGEFHAVQERWTRRAPDVERRSDYFFDLPPFDHFTFMSAATKPAMYPSTPQACRNM